MKATHDRILDMWAEGKPGPAIAGATGYTTASIRVIVCVARGAGDPRAVLRRRVTEEQRARLRACAAYARASRAAAKESAT